MSWRTRTLDLLTLGHVRIIMSADFGYHLATTASAATMEPMVMPVPGDPCPGFIAEPGCCWQNVYSSQLQATHSAAVVDGAVVPPAGRSVGPGVGVCPAPRWTDGLRQFGRRR
jgi:hypothetical protein